MGHPVCWIDIDNVVMRLSECRVPAVPAAGEPGGGGVHAPGHHVRAILELLRCSGSQQPTYLHIVRLTIVFRDEIKETD